ncbi:MAG: ATP-binding protein [Thermodesulforhabdaceae bacterium]
MVDGFGNYLAHTDYAKVYRQENISGYRWFENKKLISYFTIGYYENSLFFIAGYYNPTVGIWSIVLTPFWGIIRPTLYAISCLAIFGMCMVIVFQKSTKSWITKHFIMPLDLFSSYVKGEISSKNRDSVMIKGFFPFREGEILEESFSQAFIENYEYQKALRESEEKFRLIAETAPIGIFIFQDDRLVYANKFGSAILGYSEDELFNIVPFWKLVKEEYRDVVAYNATKRQKGILKDVVSYEFPTKTKNGEEKFVRVSVSSILFRGKPAGIIVMADVTPFKKAEEEKRHLEAQLERTQRLESLGTLVAGISHEFNNILQAIALNIEHLSSKLAELLGENDFWRRHIKDVTVLQHRAGNIVRELLAFARSQRGEKKEFSLKKEIDRVVRLSRQVFPRSIEVKVRFEGDDFTVIAEEGQLEQIFLNLLNNAKDAIEAKEEGFGVIEIIIEPTNIDDISDGSDLVVGRYAKITVRDNGIGMGPETIERIFDPFFTTKPVGKGSGLGLSVVYGVVKQLGGGISCESQLGKGTRFTLFLPVYRRKESARVELEKVDEEKLERIREDKKSFRPLRILFVEDEPAVRDLMAEFLRKEGYDVDKASDPEEALKFIESSSYDLIITDLGLPGIGGEGLLKEIKSKGIKVPIIVASGYLHGKVLENLERYGVVLSLTKPFTILALKEAIKKVEEKQRGIS